MSYIKDNDFETFELISRCMNNSNSKVSDIEELCEKTIEKIAPYWERHKTETTYNTAFEHRSTGEWC